MAEYGIPLDQFVKILNHPKRKTVEDERKAIAFLMEAAGFAGGWGFSHFKILKNETRIVLTGRNKLANFGYYQGYKLKGKRWKKIDGIATVLNVTDPTDAARELFAGEEFLEYDAF